MSLAHASTIAIISNITDEDFNLKTSLSFILQVRSLKGYWLRTAWVPVKIIHLYMVYRSHICYLEITDHIFRTVSHFADKETEAQRD